MWSTCGRLLVPALVRLSTRSNLLQAQAVGIQELPPTSAQRDLPHKAKLGTSKVGLSSDGLSCGLLWQAMSSGSPELAGIHVTTRQSWEAVTHRNTTSPRDAEAHAPQKNCWNPHLGTLEQGQTPTNTTARLGWRPCVGKAQTPASGALSPFTSVIKHEGSCDPPGQL